MDFWPYAQGDLFSGISIPQKIRIKLTRNGIWIMGYKSYLHIFDFLTKWIVRVNKRPLWTTVVENKKVASTKKLSCNTITIHVLRCCYLDNYAMTPNNQANAETQWPFFHNTFSNFFFFSILPPIFCNTSVLFYFLLKLFRTVVFY